MSDLRTWGVFLGVCTVLGPAVAHARTLPHAAMADSAMQHHAPPHSGAAHGSMHDEMPMAGMHMGATPMTGMYGSYARSREASGTSWQPDAASHEGLHLVSGPWTVMLHGFADAVYDDQGGGRGDTKLFGDNMVMAMAQRKLGPGTLGARTMFSLEPATIGKEGYPLLLQTGETGDGRTPLIDRQHPHDLFMELAGAFSVSRGKRSLFLYGGLPGEPALGPPAFMHRFSGVNIPTAPITHHWLDSSHITFGVLTAGAVVDRVKLEASGFRGREPDEHRWNIESPKLDSHSFRLSVNPTEHWAMQVSYGRLRSPEQLEPGVDQDRVTASAMYEGSWGETSRWEGTLAWGQDRNRPGRRLDAFMAEGALRRGGRHTIFARLERVKKDELFVEPDPRAGRVFDVGEATAGYRYDFVRGDPVAIGLGASGTLSQTSSGLEDAYGKHPFSGLLFLHVALR